jgi:hypothetical protein
MEEIDLEYPSIAQVIGFNTQYCFILLIRFICRDDAGYKILIIWLFACQMINARSPS